LGFDVDSWPWTDAVDMDSSEKYLCPCGIYTTGEHYNSGSGSDDFGLGHLGMCFCDYDCSQDVDVDDFTVLINPDTGSTEVPYVDSGTTRSYGNTQSSVGTFDDYVEVIST
jgi:hypothetical protein